MTPFSYLLIVGALLHSSVIQGSASSIILASPIAKNEKKKHQSVRSSPRKNNEEVSPRQERLSTSKGSSPSIHYGDDVRDLTGISYVDCQIEMVSFDEGEGLQDIIDFRCLTFTEEEEDGQSNMVYDLPNQITDQLSQRFKDGNPIHYIRILGASIYRHTLPSSSSSNFLRNRASSPPQDKILVDDDAEIIVLDEPLNRNRGRLITTVQRVNTAIVVRITTRDAKVTFDADTLSGRVFGDDVEGTLASQMAGCSFNKLKLTPAVGDNIVDGVVEVALPTTTMKGEPINKYENEMIAAIEERIGRSVSDFQHYIICVPPGAKSRHGTNYWNAYASVNGGKSIINNHNCGALIVLGHEIGHNLSLGHSGELNSEYGDDSGMMGSPAVGVHYSLVCFNGAKNWQFGWYADKSLTLKLDRFSPWRGKIFGFTDYDTSPGYVLLQVGDLYIQYNKAAKFNINTAEKINRVTVTKSTVRIASHSLSLAGLNQHQTKFELNNFAGGKSLTIEVCEYNDAGAHDYYDLLIQYGTDGAYCGTTDPSPPYPDPTAAPVTPPTQAPFEQVVLIAPSQSPSVSSSNFPTLSSVPSGSPSLLASYFPSSVPSSAPSSSGAPSAAPSVDLVCDDRKTTKFHYFNGTHILEQGCNWLAARPKMKEAYCKPDQEAYEICEETCNKCKDRCRDTANDIVYKGIVRKCTWLALRPAIQEIVCATGHESNATTICPETCDVCDGPNHFTITP